MSDKQQAIPEPSTTTRNTGSTALPGHRVLQLAGPDAVAFAQAQCMSDVVALAPGHWHWSGWLTPKGRVIALFAVLRLDDETIWLLLPDADPTELAAQLQRFVFRSKLVLSVREDLMVSGSFQPPAEASGTRFGGNAGSGLELDFSAEGGPRTLRIDSGPSPIDDPQAAERWAGFDLTHGLPRLDASQSGQWTPQQLSLQRLQAYSVKKGCYPGQEIVARTHFLGKAKRGLALMEADATLDAGMEVADGDAPVGMMTCASGALGLAVVPLEQAFTALHTGGVQLQQQPLLGGLQR